MMLEVLAVLWATGAGIVPAVAGAGLLALYGAWFTVCLGRTFRKAGFPVLLCLVPAARIWTFARIAYGTGAACLPWLVPVVRFAAMMGFSRRLAVRFGMSKFFGSCMFFAPVPFFSWLAFSPDCGCAGAAESTGRARDAAGYSGGWSVDGLYDGEDARRLKDERKKADLEELRRRMESRNGHRERNGG